MKGKGKRLLRTWHQNKPLWAVFSFLFSALLIVGSTYSWITYSDERINRSNSNEKGLSAVIDEDFEPNLKFAPGTTTTKELTVRNNGQVPAIVRVSLYEFFASFEVDTTDGRGQGNGELKEVTTASPIVLDDEDPTTWVIGHTYEVASGTYWVAEEAYVSNPSVSTTAYVYQGAAAHPALAYLVIGFSTGAIHTSPPAPGTTNYWYYENGYFYYSEILQPGDSTVPLIEEVSVAVTCPNRYKGALYRLSPVMDAHDISTALLSAWGLGSGDHAYDMYQGQLV